MACLIVAIVAALASAPQTRAQQPPQSGLSWQQRFLGILPLVKPDAKDPIVVTVNGTPITVAQVRDYAKTEQRLINANTTEETRAVFKDAMENLISRQLLIQEAERRQIKIPEGEVAQRAREFQVQGIGGETMASTGNAPDQILLDQVRGSMEIEKMLDEEFQKHKVAPSEQEIQRYYDEHKDLFVQDPGQVRLSHIAIKLPPNATDAQKADGMKRITKLARRGGQDQRLRGVRAEELGGHDRPRRRAATSATSRRDSFRRWWTSSRSRRRSGRYRAFCNRAWDSVS